MKLYANLHTHSTHSDGKFTPTQLAQQAADTAVNTPITIAAGMADGKNRKEIGKDIGKQMAVDADDYEFLKETSVVMMIGVNGVGKTTTVGKLAAVLKSQGKTYSVKRL